MSERIAPLNHTELAAALRGCLPSSLARQCLLGNQIKDPVACARHLDALLRTISTYLPRQVVAPLLADPILGRVEGSFVNGTVMFADISGFTAMSETLSRLGKAGAEEITAIVNHFFTALLKISDHYGGDLLKFGGDALLIFFGGERSALQACQAARHMQETMADFSETSTSHGVFRLQMSVGIGTGPLFMATLGSREGMEFTVMGHAMTQMAQAESRASAGQIFINDETRRAVEEIAIVESPGDQPSTSVGDTFYKLRGLRSRSLSQSSVPSDPLAILSPIPESGDPLPWIQETVERIQALTQFLPPGLMDRIKFDPERVLTGGEYRPVTIFFANFYGINDIIRQLGPTRSAEITAILNAHFRRMREVIAKYGGVVNKVDTYAVGHRIMTLFGAPRAHVDDPERAVRAALEMQEAMSTFAELETSCGTFSLKQRIGVNTGLVFAGNVGSPHRQEYSVMGDEVNLAARLMGVALEGQVLVSQNTARQSGTAFLLREQEPVRVKGKSKPVPNYEAAGLREQRAREHHPLLGRDEEWDTIHTVSEQALAGQVQALSIAGDVGLGKSRLLEELSIHWREGHNALCVGTACPSFGRHTPYLPWLELLRLLFGFDAADSTRVKLDKIETLLGQIDPAWRDWSVLIARLLGLEVETTDIVRILDAQTRQRLIFQIVTGVVNHSAGEQPLLLTIDDLQWADDTSVELVNHVVRQASDVPLLIALAHRTEETMALEIADLPYHTTLQLRELSEEASLHLLDMLLPTTPEMPQRLKSLILKNAQGTPLFIEEMAHTLIENYLIRDEASGAYRARADLEQIEVPDTVNRVIMSRLDRLDEGSRNVLRVASVIGREFKHWMLTAIYPYRRVEGELEEQLSALSEREILEGPHQDLLYLFRHILTREVAYESLLYADRRRLHRRIGESIESQRVGRLGEYWEVLAYHFSLAEAWEKALDYHLKAAHRAQEVYANEDAIHHFHQALKAAAQVEGSETQRLRAHEGLAEVLDTLGRYEQALDHLQGAPDLVMMIGGSPEEMAQRLANLCRKTAAIHEKQSDYNVAFDWLTGGIIALEGLETVEKAHVYLMGAGIYHRCGNNAEALQWCQRSLDIAVHLPEADETSQKVMAHTYYLQGAIYLRYGDNARAIDVCRKSIDLYEQLGDLAGAGSAHNNLATAYFNQGALAQAAEHYQTALEIQSKIGNVHEIGLISNNLGGVHRDRGQLDRAEALYQQSLQIWQALGSIYGEAFLYMNLATVALKRQEWIQANQYLGQCQELCAHINAEDFLAEVYRHTATAYLGRGQIDRAEAWAMKSLDLAQAQEMKLEEGATRRVLGQIHRARSNWEAAERELRTSRGILEALGSQYEMGQTLLQLAQVYKDRGRTDQFHETLQRATDIFESLDAQTDLAQARALT